MKGVRSRKISGAASPVVQLFATSWGVPYCLRRILRQSQAAAVCIAGEPRHAHLTEQGKLGWARENDGRCNGRSGTRRRSNRCSGVVSALVTVGVYCRKLYWGAAVGYFSRQVGRDIWYGITFYWKLHECVSQRFQVFSGQCRITSVHCAMVLHEENICTVLNELSTKCETIYCRTSSVTRQKLVCKSG